ncbi:NAD(P)/FAD-dependent oxidoreductase [Pseudooceanicola marinus]|uniref:NAD(P)/FAD-dependent oxidoreductase n=1 Tax=Pseudooceanicola marinus TaxID=396013 RepID=UPI001CD761DA|nr:FAD-binding oxidoreductase [Pseudooceanicola marinus]MCA1335133.1 FAD-binding oxidoreductase [Pseudooceanicola marinus]
MRIAIIGAGVVGLSSALALIARGADVTVFDREGVAAGASRGNAGIFADYAVLPESTPDMLRQVPRMLLQPDGPLSLRWRYLPRIAPWLLRFLRAGRPVQVRHGTLAMAALMAHVRGDWDQLLSQIGAEDLRVTRGALLAYTSRRAFDADRAGWQAKAEHGACDVEPVMGERLHEMEPSLTRDLHYAIHLPNLSHCLNPHGLVERLARAVQQRGGELRLREVAGVTPTETGVRLRLPEGGAVDFDRVVLCAGAHSTALTRSLGLKIPLETERGYNVTLPDPGVTLSRPVSIPEKGYYMTPMSVGLRIGGGVELAGLKAPPRWSRVEVMARHAETMLPGLNRAGEARWMGFRPAMPDTLPVIGPVPGAERVVLAFGHGHLGLTLGATTGQMVAGHIYGSNNRIDPIPYLPTRFA